MEVKKYFSGYKTVSSRVLHELSNFIPASIGQSFQCFNKLNDFVEHSQSCPAFYDSDNLLFSKNHRNFPQLAATFPHN